MTDLPQLSLTLLEYETNDPAKGDYLSLEASAAGDGFAGRTTCWVARSDMDAFLRSLATLDSSLTGEARLRCGWGETVLLELHLAPYGHTGRLKADVAIAADGIGDIRHTTALGFLLLPSDLSTFRTALDRLLQGRVPAEAALKSSREAAV